MNKQIKSFLVECGAELVQDTHNGQSGTAIVLPKNGLFDFEKFAELIVKECASRVDNILRERKDGGGTMGDEIREHFGVEE